MSISRQLAEYCIDFKFNDLPEDVIHQAKRVLLDTIGCAIGGYTSEASRIVLETIKELTGPREATVIGSGLVTSCLNAALVNGTMVRFLDYNDTAFIIQEETYRTGYHPSEIIPSILALCEREHISGKDVIASIVLGYDLSLAFLEGVVGSGIEKRGWNGDTRGIYIVPLVAGKILGLSIDQIENAVGIAGSCHAVLGILDNPSEEYTMTKNIRFPMMAYNGLLAVALAQKGFTGPKAVIEGHGGFIEAITDNQYDIAKLQHLEGKFAIRDICLKSIIADYSSHGHLTATLNLVKQYDIRPEDIAEVIITTSQRCAEHTGDPIKKHPHNKETADHSSYYLTAIAILDRQIGPDQFQPQKYEDPLVRELIGKVVIQGEPSLDTARPAGISQIKTKQGNTYTLRVDNPRGHARNPMTDDEVISKFGSMASKHMSNQQINEIISTVFNVQELDDIGKLCKLLVFSRAGDENIFGR